MRDTKSIVKLFEWKSSVWEARHQVVRSRGEKKKPKPKTEPQNRKNRTEKSVNRIGFYEIFG